MPVFGFTGTRKGCTEAQRDTLRDLVSKYVAGNSNPDGDHEPIVGLHGDCIGADAEFDAICREAGAETACCPSNMPRMRANTGAPEWTPPAPPLHRNKDIVSASVRMFACPDGPHRMRSGTWSTIRYAVSRGVLVVIVMPDGFWYYGGEPLAETGCRYCHRVPKGLGGWCVDCPSLSAEPAPERA